MNEELIELLRNQSLMNGIGDDELKKLLPLLEVMEVDAQATVIEEGEETTDLYLLLKGEAAVLKWDEDYLFQLPLNKLESGTMFGEMSFIDSSPRSSTITTTKKTLLCKLSKDVLEKALPEIRDIYDKIIINIAKINIQRLRHANVTHVKTLRSSVRNLQIRQDWGVFLSYAIIAMGFINLVSWWFARRAPDVYSEWIVQGYWLALLFPIYFLISKFHYYIDNFGIKFNFNEKNIYEFFLLLIIGSGLVLIASHLGVNKWLPPISLSEVPLYLFYVAAFEFIVRGCFFNSFKNFTNDQKGYLTILISSVLGSFIAFPALYFNPFESLALFFIGNLFLGWSYLKLDNVIFIFAMHVIMGLFFRGILI